MKNEDLIKNYDLLSLKKLPEIVKKNGFVYKLVKRSNDRLIYSQHNKADEIETYELFLNRIKPWRLMKENWAKRRNDKTDYSAEPEYYEKFPGDEEFGKRAWTYPNLEEAELSFDAK